MQDDSNKNGLIKLTPQSIVGVHEGSLYLPYFKIQISVTCMCFQISNIILGNSVYYFLEIIMLIS